MMWLISSHCLSVCIPSAQYTLLDITVLLGNLGTINWASSCQNLFMPYANNKGADQPAQSDQHLSCSLPR